MHTALSTPFVYRGVSYTGNLSNIAQGDNFLSIVVPQIMASEAYRRNGVIVIWNDETEGANADDFTHTSVEIVISRLAKGNAFASSKDYTHSSDLRTMQEIFGVTGGGLLNDAANANDLSDMFVPGSVPTPGSLALLGLGGLALRRRRR